MRQIDGDALKIMLDTFATIVGFSGVYDRGQVMECIDAAPTVATDKWISVKDRLPEKPGSYLCWFGKNTFAVGANIVPYIQDLHWFASLESLERYENVTHWMPMPEPPEVEG